MQTSLTARLVGAALLIPAFLVWLVALVVPAVRLIVMSFQSGSFLPTRKQEFTGFDNYQSILDQGLAHSIVFGLSLAALPLLVFFAVGPVAGWAASRATATTRRIARVILVLPLAAFAPVAVALAWRDPLARPAMTATQALEERISLTVGVFGLTCVLAVAIYASVFRATGTARLRAALAVGAIAVTAALAFGLQQFGLNQLTRPRADVLTTESLIYAASFRTLRVGPGAAAATVELLILAMLGLVATGVIIGTGLRIRVTGKETPAQASQPASQPAQPAIQPETQALAQPSVPASPASPAAGLGLIAGAVAVVALAGVFLLPWLNNLGNPVDDRLVPDFAGTWIAPLLATLFAVSLAVVGGFGIGALRPLGRFSELLLIPFAPWLFTGSGPFVLPAFAGARDNQLVGSFWAVIPPLWTFVPALFLFTMLFRGQATQQASVPRKFILRVLPAYAIVVVGFWLLQTQDFLWSLVMSNPRDLTGPARLFQSFVTDVYRGGDGAAYAVMTPLWLIPLVVIGAALAQWFYADRVVITTEDR